MAGDRTILDAGTSSVVPEDILTERSPPGPLVPSFVSDADAVQTVTTETVTPPTRADHQLGADVVVVDNNGGGDDGGEDGAGSAATVKQDKRGWRFALKTLLFVRNIALYACGAMAIICWADGWDLAAQKMGWMPKSDFSVDYANGERITLKTPTREERWQLYWAMQLAWGLPLESFLHLFVLIYLQWNSWSLIRNVLAALIIGKLWYLFWVVYMNVLIMHYFSPFSNLCFLWLALRLSLPADSKIPGVIVWYLGGTLFVLQLLFFWSLVMKHIIPEAINFFIVSLFFREIGRFMAVRASWYLTVDNEVGGTGVPVRRTVAFLFYLWYQIAFAFFVRLRVSNVKDPSLGTALAVATSFFEVASRLTLEKRDLLLKRLLKNFPVLFKKQGSRRREKILRYSTRVLDLGRVMSSPIEGQAESHKESDQTQDGIALSQGHKGRRKAEKLFYSSVILCEMLGEYVAVSCDYKCCFSLIILDEFSRML